MGCRGRNPHGSDARAVHEPARKLVRIAINANAYNVLARYARMSEQRPDDFIRATLEEIAARLDETP